MKNLFLIRPRKLYNIGVLTITCVILVALLTGCAEGKSDIHKAGKRIMNEYLKSRDSKAYITESHADLMRPDASVIMASDYVKGTCKIGGEAYDFAVDTATGRIYTTEKAGELKDCFSDILLDKLDLDADSCVTDCWFLVDRPAWSIENPEYPYEMAALGEVVPVDASDLQELALKELESSNTQFCIYIAESGKELSPDSYTTEDIRGWEKVTIYICDVDSAGGVLPDEDSMGWNYVNSFEGNKIMLCTDKVEFTPAK